MSDSPYNYSVAIRVNRMILVSLCAETMKPVSEGDIIPGQVPKKDEKKTNLCTISGIKNGRNSGKKKRIEGRRGSNQ